MAAAPADPGPDAASIRWIEGEVEVRPPVGRFSEAGVRRLVGRALATPEVVAVHIDRETGAVRIRPRAPFQPSAFLQALATAMRSRPAVPIDLSSAPRGSCTLHRHGDRASTCEVLIDRPGWLRLRHPRLKADRLAARDCRRRIADAPGVVRVHVEGRTGTLNVRGAGPTSLDFLIREVEAALDETGPWDGEATAPPRTSFALTNANLAVGAGADLVTPALGPVGAAMLVAANLKTFRQAWGQVRERKAGLPVLYTVIVGGTLASGNFLASALMSWSFKYWQDRLRVDLSEGRRRMLSECLPTPTFVEVDRPSGPTREPLREIRPGDRVRLGPGEAIPADGRVTSGRGVVALGAAAGSRGASRVDEGDEVLAGGTVLCGTFTMEAARPFDHARAAKLGRALLAATDPTAAGAAATRNAQAFAEKAVPPTFLAAGFGLAAGGLDVATAVLRPDYATGPGIAGSLGAMRNAAACARIGLAVRSPDALDRLAQVDLVLLDDSPELHRRGVQVESIQSNLPEPLVLRYAASAFRHMADDRASALEDACRDRGLPLLDLLPLDFEEGVTVAHGEHRIVVREEDRGPLGSLRLEIDGRDAGRIAFSPSERPAAASEIARLKRRTGLPVALLSHRPPAAASARGAALGTDLAIAGLSSADKAAHLDGLRRRGAKAAFVGDCNAHPAAAKASFATVCTSGSVDATEVPTDAVLMRRDFGLLAEAMIVARESAASDRSARRFIALPGALCVAGAMFFGVTSLAVVVVSNLGTLQLYRHAAEPLRRTAKPRLRP